MHALHLQPSFGRSLHDRRRRYAQGVPLVPPHVDEREIDAAFARGELDLRTVYDRHGALVYSICRRTLGDEAAKDATQEVFINAWRKRSQFDPARGALGAWLVGITKRRVIDQLRSERRHADRRADEPPADRLADGDVPPDRVADRMLAAELLKQLPSRTREVLELVYVHDLTHQEVADRTGLPLGTVKSDARRGILKIRQQMESNDV